MEKVQARDATAAFSQALLLKERQAPTSSKCQSVRSTGLICDPSLITEQTLQVTYTDLDLGEGHNRLYSRQSNPNIRADLGDFNSRSSRRFKSAPTTPTKLRSRSRATMIDDADVGLPPTASNGNGTHRPQTATSVYSQETTFSGYPDENASSWDSRSLGRDSALGPYMSASYGRPNNGYHMDTPDRPNPFVPNSSIANEAENVVSMFLMNMNSSPRRNPGRIEDLPSPLATSDDPQPSSFDEDDGGVHHNRTVISQLRRDFFNKDFPTGYQKTEPEAGKKTNKYLQPEHRWSKPPVAEPQDVGTVQGFVAPQMHHAEVVHVRQDSSSSEDPETTTLTEQDRSFEDPALSQFRSETHQDQGKKRGFLSKVFGRKSKRPSAAVEEEELPQSEGDEADYVEEPRLLPRKRSMSKPTDLDEILRLQEAMEKEQSVAEVFANDPFFQSTLQEYNIDLPPSVPARVDPIPQEARNIPIYTMDEPIYENQHKPCMDTTQEIDIDALLGYADEKAIENIEWPSSNDIAQDVQPPAAPPEDQGIIPTTNAQVEIDYAQPVAKPSKRGFFSFGKKSKKKPSKSDEVSYYIEEPQPEPELEPEAEPEPETPMPQDLPQALTSEEEELPHNQEDLNRSKSPGGKPGFFKFKSSKRRESDHQEAKPSFFKLKGKKSSPSGPPERREEPEPDHESLEPMTLEAPESDPVEVPNVNEPPEDTVVVENNEQSDNDGLGPIREEKPSFVRQISRADTSTDSEPVQGRKVLPSKNKFAFGNLFKSQSKKSPKQIGSMAPVDVSHLVDPDEEPPEDVPQQVQEADTASQGRPGGRSRQRNKSTSSGFGAFFGPPKPRSGDQFSRDNRRSKSLPRQRSSTKPRGGQGLSDFFGPAPTAVPPQQPLERPASASSLKNTEDQPSRPEASAELPPVQRAVPKSRSTGGFFSMKPKQPARNPRRPPGPPPNPPTTAPASEDEKASRSGSMASLASRQKSKGLSSFLSASPMRKSMPRSQTFPAPRQEAAKEPAEMAEPPSEPEISRPASKTGSMSSLASRQRKESKGLSNFLNASPMKKNSSNARSQTFPTPPRPEDTDKIELAPEQPPRHEAEAVPAPTGPRRVQGRQSGRFRRQSNQHTPSQLQGPHRQPPAPTTTLSSNSNTEQSLTRDLFAEAVNRPSRGPSRRGSMNSLHQVKENADVLPPDSEYDQAVDKGMANNSAPPPSRQAMRNYNSLPRLGNRQKQQQQQQRQQQDPETRSLGEPQGPSTRSRQRRTGPRGKDDNCQMM